ncbi:VOC family protein [Pseudaestuariivita sp.]|uniref:VOC family protein n=1 Tax=Pseudaestuariivita sp. TaxID=2211669 RepID=UPI004058B348
MALISLDHLAVACTTLDEGRAAVETALGVPLQTGGQHAHFGTHNLLLGLEDGLYLEVIAIDPDAPKPDYPRWFDLDRFRGLPRLTNWICRTEDMDAATAKAPGTGVPVPLARGDLRWEMAVPESGILPFANLFPALIRWHGTAHPAPLLTQQGVRLRQLVLETPEAEGLAQALAPLIDDPRLVIEQSDRSAMHASFDTPGGRRWL